MAAITVTPSITDDAILQRVLAQLVGLPFLFARPSYGEELTLHFGEARPMGHPSLRHLTEGSHIVRSRLSGWEWRSFDGITVSMRAGEQISSAEFRERCNLLKAAEGTRVSRSESEAVPGDVEASALSRCLRLTFSEGSHLYIYPETKRQAIGADDDEIADWEVFTPDGCLLVGPGQRLAWEPAA